MIVKLAKIKILERVTPIVAQQLSEELAPVIHVPRPADEQTGRKKAPIRIVTE